MTIKNRGNSTSTATRDVKPKRVPPPPPLPLPPNHTTAGSHGLFRRGTFNIQTDVCLYLIYYKIAALKAERK